MRGRRSHHTIADVIAAIFNLNHPAHMVHWHFISLSVSNVIVIVLMFVVFFAAILLPFPGHSAKGLTS